MAAAALAAIERHPHLAQPCPDGWVRVDMHSHTMFSGDSTTTLDEIIESVVEAGIDVLCVTDHNAIEGAVRLQKALDGVCRVIVGEEVRTHTGEIIGLFMTQKVSYMRRNLTEESLIQITELGLVDAIEGHNAKTSLQSLNKRAVAFGEQHDLALGSGSDAHVPHALGSAYMQMPDFDGPQDFLAKVREGQIIGHHWDKARPWSARIVPSVVNDDY